MTDQVNYFVWHTSMYPDFTDADGDRLPKGWYYQFPKAHPVGPFPTGGRAEAAAEAEIAEYESALAAEF